MDGPLCTCGNTGCLEALIGTIALRQAIQDALATGRPSALRDGPGEPYYLFTEAANGDELAKEIVARFATHLGAGIVSLIHAYDPDVVILGGGMMQSSTQFLSRVQKYVDTHAWTIPRRRVRLLPAQSGDAAALVGITACKPGARVFLGLHDDTSIADFQNDAEAARDYSVAFDINKHVHSVVSEPHKLFLIPSGTVHCSGADNLVLEISATPYIYTFKIYDYLRSDLSGNLRHVHLDRAFANINETRRATWTDEHLCPQPVALRTGETWGEYSIGNIEALFFAIHRLEFTDRLEDHTQSKFVALNMVEGECCEILSDGNEPIELHYAESLIIPASIDHYTLRNIGTTPCKVVKAFVKG